jgi:Flp pilus assembly pilin Flp
MLSFRLIVGGQAVAVIDMRRSVSREDGQALIEHALIISLIAVAAIAVLQTTGVNIKGLLNKSPARSEGS